jgi:DNA-binding PadR family transcriptional regulator
MFSEEQVKNLYSDLPRPQILQKVHEKFQISSNYCLTYELATVYVLSVLNKKDSYAWEMEQELIERTIFRVSSTVLSKVLEDLSSDRVVNTYIRKLEGRGRPKIMYKLSSEWYIHAIALVRYWEEFVKSSKLFKLIETLNTSNLSDSEKSKHQDDVTALGEKNVEIPKPIKPQYSDLSSQDKALSLELPLKTEVCIENIDIESADNIETNYPDTKITIARYPQVRLIPDLLTDKPKSIAKWESIDRAGIAKILEYEQVQGRIPDRKAHNHPGYDIESRDLAGNIRYIEVKSITGKWDNCNVCMTPTQFDLARQLGSEYWLYVVERAEEEREFKIYTIQDPANKSSRIAFNGHWKKHTVVTR